MRLSQAVIAALLALVPVGCKSDEEKLVRLYEERDSAASTMERLRAEDESLGWLKPQWQVAAKEGPMKKAMVDSVESAFRRHEEALKSAEARLQLAERELRLFLDGR